MSAVRAALLGLLLAAPAARAADVLQELGIPAEPPPRGVYDGTGLLDAGTLVQLEDLGMRLRQGSGHEVLVVAVPTLKEHPIEDVGLQIGRQWKLGEVGVSDAAVLLIAREEREVRIEVGRGLEGNLTDLVCGNIIRNVIVPRFQLGDFGGGVLDGVQAIHAAAGGDYADIPDDAPVNVVAPVLIAVAVIVLVLIMLIRAGVRSGRGRGGGGGWRGPVILPILFPTNVGGSSGGGFSGGFGGGGGGGGFRGFGGGGGGFSGGGASGRW